MDQIEVEFIATAVVIPMGTKNSKPLRFIDLFAGLGGFHLALERLGHKCVFACEIDDCLKALYKENFGISPAGDMRAVDPSSIAPHELLCAGFPCQPFSKAGDQAGTKCPRWGDLFDYVINILRSHRPKYLLLENVPNLLRHNAGRTWAKMMNSLEHLGYDVSAERLSPHNFGIPQVRDRVFVVGCLSGLQHFEWPMPNGNRPIAVQSLLESKPVDARPLSAQVISCLNVWQQFLAAFPAGEELPSFPIWAMEFGATYPYEGSSPHSIGGQKLRPYKGSFGIPLGIVPPADRMELLPSYARGTEDVFPRWKEQFIRQNRELYLRHRSWIEPWVPKLMAFPHSLQKLEWNCKGEERNIWQYFIQFRASGVRVKRPTTSPSLIAMTSTQVPIVGWERRYLTPRECARLQSMEGLPRLPESTTRAFKALGNAVNVELAYRVAGNLLCAPPSCTDL